jgi:putative membrane protein
LDVIWQGFSLVMLNATICTILHESVGITYSKRFLGAWNTVFSLVLTTSLAFLLVFRLNRIAMRYWEARSMWGDLTKHSRSLVSMILVHCSHNEKYRDSAISWVGSFAVAVIHFMRNDKEIPPEELSGFLTRVDVHKMQDSNHYALYAASRIRYALVKAMTVTCDTPIQVAHSQSIQLNLMEEKINELINQVSGMEKIRSTPLPIVYVSHLRTFLFLYLMFLPYIWVDEWGWSTIPLMAFTAFALMGIEGAATECEVPFRKDRANHLAMEGYAMVLLNNIQGLVIQAANMDMEERQNEEL